MNVASMLMIDTRKPFDGSILIYLLCYFLIYDIEVAFFISLGISI
jgi:hypothetical protein